MMPPWPVNATVAAFEAAQRLRVEQIVTQYDE